MADPAANAPDPSLSPATDRAAVPVQRLGTPATETTEDSIRAEDDAVADEPDTGGLTPSDGAQ